MIGERETLDAYCTRRRSSAIRREGILDGLALCTDAGACGSCNGLISGLLTRFFEHMRNDMDVAKLGNAARNLSQSPLLTSACEEETWSLLRVVETRTEHGDIRLLTAVAKRGKGRGCYVISKNLREATK